MYRNQSMKTEMGMNSHVNPHPEHVHCFFISCLKNLTRDGFTFEEKMRNLESEKNTRSSHVCVCNDSHISNVREKYIIIRDKTDVHTQRGSEGPHEIPGST